MDSIERTRIWKTTLGQADYGSPATNHFVEALRVSFRSFRENAKIITGHLPQDMRQLTVHDMTHIDALWEIADTVCPDDFIANPLEAYVLGGAFLLHDLGLALVAYPRGLEGLKETDEWKNAASKLPADAGGDLEQDAIDNTLRLRHASQAATLGTCSFPVEGSPIYLLDNPTIRDSLGELIGVIAESHWWYPDDLERSQKLTTRGAIASPDCPAEWTIDSRKLAYLLRVCDACQIDGRRAPALVRSLRKPTGVSKLHWDAQQTMQKPYCAHGQMIFSASRPFAVEKMDAWWVAYDLARTADRELRAAEDYFSSSPRKLQVNRVAGISSPQQFATHVPVDGWLPVDSQPKISSVASVIEKLGGSMLYGADFTVPLRELIQNARDAVVARRHLESHDEQWGRIDVQLWKADDCEYLSVSDNGIGLSEKKILQFLLDFGESYWNSPLCQEEYPKLATTGFEPVGMFGIGFFSVFMLSDSVKITTRRPEDGINDTRILEFTSGLSSRPLLRGPQSDDERLNETGTRVLVELRSGITSEETVLKAPPPPIDLANGVPQAKRTKWELKDLVAWLVPASDVDIWVRQKETASQLTITANDWKYISNEDLMRRLLIACDNVENMIREPLIKSSISRIHEIKDAGNKVVGRACINPLKFTLEFKLGILDLGLVTCGPFRSKKRMPLMPGLMIGEAQAASRFGASPLFEKLPYAMSEWGTRQAVLVLEDSNFDADAFNQVASLVRSICGDIGGIPIVVHRGKLVALNEVKSAIADLPEVKMYSAFTEFQSAIEDREYKFKDLDLGQVGVVMGQMYAGKIVRDQGGSKSGDPQNRAHHKIWREYWYAPWGATIEAVAQAWSCDLQMLIECSEFTTIDYMSPYEVGAVLRNPNFKGNSTE